MLFIFQLSYFQQEINQLEKEADDVADYYYDDDGDDDDDDVAMLMIKHHVNN